MVIAIVSHKYGNNGYVANTLDELDKEIAKEFVHLWYTEIGPTEAQQIKEALDAGMWNRAVQLYFVNHPDDTLLVAIP